MAKLYDSGAEPERTPGPRKGLRICLSAEVSLRRSGRGSFRVSVIDLSLHGCKAEFVERPNLDEWVWVKFGDLQSVKARVCWIRGFEVGLEFERSIHPAVFEMLSERHKT